MTQETTTTTTTKPGVRTTEFWAKSIIQLVLILNALFGLGIEIDEVSAMQIVAGLEAVYAIGRSIAKRGGQ